MRNKRSLTTPSHRDRPIQRIRAGEFSSSNLAEKLEVSEQAIYRDIDFLASRG